MTNAELRRQIAEVCQSSALVESYAMDTIDEDTLSVRAFLVDASFINAFYNIATDKTAFAWISESKRVYGKNNAKMGWRVHPFRSPEQHLPCEPINYAVFVRQVENFHSQV